MYSSWYEALADTEKSAGYFLLQKHKMCLCFCPFHVAQQEHTVWGNTKWAGFGDLRRLEFNFTVCLGSLHSQFGQDEQLHPLKTVSKCTYEHVNTFLRLTWLTEDINLSTVSLCVDRCPTLTWKRRPSSPSSRRSWPFCQVKHTHTHTHTHTLSNYDGTMCLAGAFLVGSVIRCLLVCLS